MPATAIVLPGARWLPSVRRNAWRTAACWLAVLATGGLAAAPPLAPPPSGAAAVRETEPQTIARCQQDLTAEDAEVRRRAVLILGKYNSEVAVQAVLGCLADPAADVRQAALVSLAEKPLIPAQATLPIVQLLADPSLEVRRIASAVVADLVLRPGIHLQTIVNQQENRAAIGAAVNAALADTDVIVRKNVLALYQHLGRHLDPAAVVVLLGDADAEIRRLALLASRMLLPPQQHGALVKPLLADPAISVRLEVVQTLARLRPAPVDMLKVMAADPDLEVRTKAIQELVRLQSPGALALAVELISDRTVPVKLRQLLLPYLRSYGDAGKEILLELAQDGSQDLAATAVEALANGWSMALPLEFWLACQQRPVQRIRVAVRLAILQQAAQLTHAQLQAMCTSPYADVRKLAVVVAQQLPPAKAEAICLELLLDADAQVRMEVIQQFAQRSLANWQRILARSLRHPDAETSRATVGVLLQRGDPASLEILNAFLPDCADPELAKLIMAAIRNRRHYRRQP